MILLLDIHLQVFIFLLINLLIHVISLLEENHLEDFAGQREMKNYSHLTIGFELSGLWVFYLPKFDGFNWSFFSLFFLWVGGEYNTYRGYENDSAWQQRNNVYILGQYLNCICFLLNFLKIFIFCIQTHNNLKLMYPLLSAFRMLLRQKIRLYQLLNVMHNNQF